MNGRAPGFTSFALYLPVERVAVIVLSNIYSSATTNIGNDIGAIVLGKVHAPFAPAQSMAVTRPIGERDLAFTFGKDFYQPGATLVVMATANGTYLRWPGGDLLPLIPVGHDHFLDRTYWVPVAITRDSLGRPAALMYDRFRSDIIEAR